MTTIHLTPEQIGYINGAIALHEKTWAHISNVPPAHFKKFSCTGMETRLAEVNDGFRYLVCKMGTGDEVRVRLGDIPTLTQVIA